jgi:hypothetical protein
MRASVRYLLLLLNSNVARLNFVVLVLILVIGDVPIRSTEHCALYAICLL